MFLGVTNNRRSRNSPETTNSGYFIKTIQFLSNIQLVRRLNKIKSFLKYSWEQYTKLVLDGVSESETHHSTLIERCIDINYDMYMCFVDFSKAFDKVQHRKLIDILQTSKMDNKYVKIIIRVDNHLSKEIIIKWGVRLGIEYCRQYFSIYFRKNYLKRLCQTSTKVTVNQKKK